MEGVAVTRIKDQNFQVMYCLQVASFKGKEGTLEEDNIQELVTPLIEEGYNAVFVNTIKSKVKDFVSNLFDQEDGIKKMDFKDNADQEYSILCHKIKPVIFGFLLRPLSDEDLQEIEKNSTGKTYITGDMNDMFKTEKDFH